MPDDAYVKSIEEENEKLRQQLADTQELLDTANAKIKISGNSDYTDAGKYVPHEKEIVHGFQLYEVSQVPIPGFVLVSCLRSTKSWLGKEKKDWLLFRVKVVPSSNKGYVDITYYSYPDGRDMDDGIWDEDRKLKREIAKQMFTIARQSEFLFMSLDQQKNEVMYLPFYVKNGKKRSLKAGNICYEPA